MALFIRCEEGVVIRGDSADELVARLEAHLCEAHADLCGRFSPDEIRALANDENDANTVRGGLVTS